jgi:hypothetical protein
MVQLMENKKYVTLTSVILVFLLLASFGVETTDRMPPYGIVFIDYSTKTYIALPCVEKRRYDPDLKTSMLKLSTRREARKIGYSSDDKCRNAGGFAEDGRSLGGILLVKLGILPPLKHWWDKPYRTEDDIIYPH